MAVRRLRGLPIAGLCFLLSLIVLGSAVWAIGPILVPDAQGPLAIRGIWAVSLFALLIGLVFGFLDVRWLAREWAALDSLNHSDALSRSEKYAARRRPLIAQRAAQVGRLRSDPQSVGVGDLREHLRRDAAGQSSHIGSATRFLGSALLLLAVIGTFAGMKAALPPLIDYIQTVPGSQGFVGFGDVLTPIAEAFGANFLALLSSLSLGLVAFGAFGERRRLLYKLDDVSERQLYVQLPAGASADALAHAVREMKENVGAVIRVGDGIQGLQSSIGTFEQTLREAIDGLRSSFTQTIQQQSNQIQSQLNDTIGKVVISMQDISAVLGTTAVAYEGLVVGLHERDLNVQKASEAMERVGQDLSSSMTEASGTLQQAAESAASTHEVILRQAKDSREAVAEAATALQAQGAAIADSMLRHSSALESLPARLDEATNQQRQALGELRADLKSRADELGQTAVSAGESIIAGVGSVQRSIEAVAERQSAESAAIVGALEQTAQSSAATHEAVDGTRRAVAEATTALQVQGSAIADSLTARADEVGQAIVSTGESIVGGLGNMQRSMEAGADRQTAASTAHTDFLRDELVDTKTAWIAGLESRAKLLQAELGKINDQLANGRRQAVVEEGIKRVEASVKGLAEEVSQTNSETSRLTRGVEELKSMLNRLFRRPEPR